MNVRKILQSAFWSRKALLRILIGLGILIVTLVLVAVVWYEAQMHWLTPGERKAGKAVLAQIDSLQNLELTSRKDFEARESGLQEKLNEAGRAAWTFRDHAVFTELYFYVYATERERAAVWEQNQMQPGDSSITSSDRELNRKEITTEEEEVRFYRLILHEQLD
jgi:hypothetical protein